MMTIWRMRTACWIPKATNTHSEYVTIMSFPRQQWLRERASLSRYIYIACLRTLRRRLKYFPSHLILTQMFPSNFWRLCTETPSVTFNIY